MLFGVATEELEGSASILRGDADEVGSLTGSLERAGVTADGWVVGRARRAAQAFFDTLARASQDTGTGLRDLGDRVAAGAGAYDGVETGLSAGP